MKQQIASIFCCDYIMSANSGIKWIDQTFDYCVQLLIDLASILGITYEEINVWLFCVIWPLLTLLMFGEILRLRLRQFNNKQSKV